jgi:hypothetical protein
MSTTTLDLVHCPFCSSTRKPIKVDAEQFKELTRQSLRKIVLDRDTNPQYRVLSFGPHHVPCGAVPVHGGLGNYRTALNDCSTSWFTASLGVVDGM